MFILIIESDWAKMKVIIIWLNSMVKFNFSRKEENFLITFKCLVWREKDFRKTRSTILGKAGVRKIIST